MRPRTRRTGAPTSSSPQSEPMREKIFASLLAAAIVLAATPARAATKEHQQLMADRRILQEQSQQLQNLLGTLNDAIKAVNTRLDQQAETTRKAFADQKLVVDNLTNDVRIIREKLDDNNVRIGSLTQEVDSLRQSLQQAGRPTPTAEPDAAASAQAGSAPAPTPPPVGVSPKSLFESAQSDYFAGQYDLAVVGFSEYIRSFPKSDL